MPVRSPIPSFVRWTVVLTVIGALSFAALQYWNGTQFGLLGQGFTQTEFGPLGPADRDLLIKVRQAGLWEIPTGQQAEQLGSSARVREVGRLLAAEHTDLDQQVRDVAAQLGVALPNQPSDQQQQWMNEIALAGQNGRDFDRTFVQRLREAHGKVLPVIAEVRSGTKNEAVREFAEVAAEFVTRHHQYLESTGLVDFSALPDPPAPDTPPAVTSGPGTAPPAAASSTSSLPFGAHSEHISPVANASAAGGSNVLIAGVVYVAAILAMVGLVFLLGSAGFRSRRGGTRRQLAAAGAHSVPDRAGDSGRREVTERRGRRESREVTERLGRPDSREVTERRNRPEPEWRDVTQRDDAGARPGGPGWRDVTAPQAVTAAHSVPDRRGLERRGVAAPRGASEWRGPGQGGAGDRPRHAAQPW